MIPVKKDLVDSGVNLLLHQFQDKPNLKGFFSTFLQDLENINRDTFDLVNQFNVDGAYGIYLDNIGDLVGEKRENESDDEYRNRIKIRILINNSKGSPNEILEIVSQVTETDNVRLWEHYPLFTMLYTDGSDATLPNLVKMRRALPITCEADLMVDTTRRGWVGAEFYDQLGNLVDDAGNKIVDESGNIFITKAEGSQPAKPPTGRNSKLAEILDQSSNLVDDASNQIVDENGNRIVLFTTAGKVFSNDGVFVEIIS